MKPEILCITAAAGLALTASAAVPPRCRADVQLTLFRQKGMSDAKFAADAEWVGHDLLALKALVTH